MFLPLVFKVFQIIVACVTIRVKPEVLLRDHFNTLSLLVKFRKSSSSKPELVLSPVACKEEALPLDAGKNPPPLHCSIGCTEANSEIRACLRIG